jgi:hypothetical protein
LPCRYEKLILGEPILSQSGESMRKISGSDDPWSIGGKPLSARTKRALLRRRTNGLRALEEAEQADDLEAAAEARKQVQDAQRLILRYGLE